MFHNYLNYFLLEYCLQFILTCQLVDTKTALGYILIERLQTFEILKPLAAKLLSAYLSPSLCFLLTTDTCGHIHTDEYPVEVALGCMLQAENSFGVTVGGVVDDKAGNMTNLRSILRQKSD